MAEFVTGISVNTMPSNNRMQSDFSELALTSAADARRYVLDTICLKAFNN